MLDFLFSISWRQPLWILLAFFPVALYWVLAWQRDRQQNNFADKHLLPWLEVHKKKAPLNLFMSRNTAYFLAWFLFSLALAGPRIPDQLAKNKNNILMDIMLVLDLSRSMQATDVKPSRLRRATLEIYDLLSLLTVTKNARIGVIVYAARPHLYIPLTSDYKALKFYLNDVDTLQLPTQGSKADLAMKLARKELLAAMTATATAKATKGHKQFVIWLTDGDYLDAQDNKNIKQLKTELLTLSQKNINTYILGLGTEEGAAIPLVDGGWLQSEGQPVISRMNQKLLQSLSEISANPESSKTKKFMAVTADNSDWDMLYTNGILKSISPSQSNTTQQWKELYQWLLFPAVILLIMALFPITFLVKKNSVKKNSVKKNRHSFFVLIFTFLLFELLIQIMTPPVIADELGANKTTMGNAYDINLAKGTEAYRRKEFIKAKRFFINSVLAANAVADEKNNSDITLNKARAIALHNLGNSVFQMGDYAVAAELFTDALRYAPEQKQSAKNQALSVALFIEMEKRRKRRMNRGNLAAVNENSPLFDLPEQLPFMLSSKAIMLLKASLPKLPEEALNRLLENQLAQFDLLQSDNKLIDQKLKKQKELDMQQAHLFLLDQEEQTATAINPLWKRLFEIEEGFPGRLKTPKTIPGVRPW